MSGIGKSYIDSASVGYGYDISVCVIAVVCNYCAAAVQNRRYIALQILYKPVLSSVDGYSCGRTVFVIYVIDIILRAVIYGFFTDILSDFYLIWGKERKIPIPCANQNHLQSTIRFSSKEEVFT